MMINLFVAAVALFAALTTPSGVKAQQSGESTTITAYACSQATSCEECLDESSGCNGVWQSDSTCQTSCLLDEGECVSLSQYPGQAADTICSLASTQATDKQLCRQAGTDCSTCTSQVLTDGSSTCQWFPQGQYCSSACDSTGCGATTCSDETGASSSSLEALCRGLACNFCLELNCAWAPSMGCFASCDGIGVDENCLQGSQYSADEICVDTPPQACDGLQCEFCMGVGSCAWDASQQKCVSSCNDTATERGASCFPSESFQATDVCNTNDEDTEQVGDEEEQDEEQEDEDGACDAFTACSECLEAKCDWATNGVGCIGNCSVFDMSCYPGAVYRNDAIQVCGDETEGSESAIVTSAAAATSVATMTAATVVSNILFSVLC